MRANLFPLGSLTENLLIGNADFAKNFREVGFVPDEKPTTEGEEIPSEEIDIDSVSAS